MKLTIKEFAAKKGISEQAVYKQINHGRIKEEYVTKENGKTFIDEAALAEAVEEAPKEEKKDERERYIETLEEQVKELRAELKEQREAQAQIQNRILSLLEQQTEIQKGFQILLAREQLPSPSAGTAGTEEPVTVETEVETVEKVESKLNETVENTGKKKARKWLFFKRRAD